MSTLIFAFWFFQQEKEAEAFGQMIGGILFFVVLAFLVVWGISKIIKRK
jgi:hypothetical protein